MFMRLFERLFPSLRELEQLRARVTKLEQETDVAALEMLHQNLLKAFRALRRTQQAQEAREAHPEGNGGPDPITAAILARRARGILPSR